jgi:hypothetical protein
MGFLACICRASDRRQKTTYMLHLACVPEIQKQFVAIGQAIPEQQPRRNCRVCMRSEPAAGMVSIVSETREKQLSKAKTSAEAKDFLSGKKP